MALSVLVALAAGGAAQVALAQALEEVTITAQRRETSLQTTGAAVTAISGAAIAEDKLFNVGDIANAVPAFSMTALTPLDMELNMRGITNTRLDSPTADPSVGTFVDGVYVGRTGDYNFDLYDLERIEVIRGPQGVLLGKNVVGGAISILTAKPEFTPGGQFLASYGNYDAILLNGHITGGLTDTLAGRFSFQYRDRDGFAKDILHDRDVENITSYQARAQLMWDGGDTGWGIRGIVDYSKDESNGINTVAIAGGTASCETSYLRSNCTRPWSNLRTYLGVTNPRENMAQSVQLQGGERTQQFLDRHNWGATLDIEKDAGSFTFNSLTGYREVESEQLYDQTGIGPEALGWDPVAWGGTTSPATGYVGWTDTTFGGSPLNPFRTFNNGRFLFAQPVWEEVTGDTFSQEFRFTSNPSESRWDWIGGVYYKKDNVEKTDHFIGENFLGLVFPGGNNPLSTLSGENEWINDGSVENTAGFAQVGFKFTDAWKLNVGVRYTEDKKSGTVSGYVVATGDRFNPNDPRPNVTMEGLCRTPEGAVVTPTPAVCAAPNRWIYSAGEGYVTNYSEKWTETTPQATLEWTANEDLFMYATVAKGFKGGGFDDTPANVAQATTPFDPETAWNYEIGIKTDLLDNRLRINADVFFMDYENLQVTQTNAACLCNITDNAAAAEIKGLEAEIIFAATDALRFNLSGSYVDAKYVDFLESATIPGTNPPQRLDSSGNRLQRTPETQISAGVDYSMNLGQWSDALHFRVDYAWQSDMFWATDNIAKEDAYGLLNARIALSPDEAPWTVAVWGRNLTDELYRVNIISFFGEEVSQFGAPQTYGIDFSWNF